MATKKSNTILSIETILLHMTSDLYSYSEDLAEINGKREYFTKNNRENQKYWSDWFTGKDMTGY